MATQPPICSRPAAASLRSFGCTLRYSRPRLSHGLPFGTGEDMKMRSYEIIPTEEAKQPSPCHPDRGSEGAPNFVIPTEGHRARAEGSMWSDTLSSAKPDRQKTERFCPFHRFLDSAFGLARNDKVVSRLRQSSGTLMPTEATKRLSRCRPDRGNSATQTLSSRPRKQSDPHPVPGGSRSKLSGR